MKEDRLIEIFGHTQQGKVFSFDAIQVMTFHSRLRGLTKSEASVSYPLVFENCKSVHTFGMTYSIDIAFVREGRVIEARRACAPSHIWTNRFASAVIERPSQNAPWLKEGDAVVWKYAM